MTELERRMEKKVTRVGLAVSSMLQGAVCFNDAHNDGQTVSLQAQP